MKRLLIFIAASIVFGGCLSPAQKLQKAHDEYNKIGQQWEAEHPCPIPQAKSDTIILTDSSSYFAFLAVLGRLAELDSLSDSKADSTAISLTSEFNDVIDSLIKHPGTILKKWYIHDTTKDVRTENSLREALNDKDIEIATLTGEKAGTKLKTDQQVSNLRGWILKLSIGGILLFLLLLLLLYFLFKK